MTYRDVVLNDNPEAYWRLGESSGSTAFDETANGHDGTYQGDPTLGAAGALTNDDDTAVYMDGAGDAVDLGDIIDPQVGSFTLEAWVKVDDVSVQAQRIQVKQDGTDGWALSVGDPGSGAIRFFIRESATIVSLDTATGVVSNGVWHHVVGVYDASAGTRKIYVDAVEEASATDDTGGFPTNTVKYGLMAGTEGGVQNEMAGVADEFAVYLSALSATQIQEHYDEATKEVITFNSHIVVLNHMPQFDGRFSPHKILLNHFKAVPAQPHIVNLAHQPIDTLTDTSEEGQRQALRKLLGYGWGVPDPSGSANEKIETPRESWPINRFGEAERLLRQGGVDEDTVKGVGEAMRRLGEDIQLDVRANLQKAEWHANVHTHPSISAGGGRGTAKYIFAGTTAPSVIAMRASNGNTFWTYTDLGGNVFGIAADDDRNTYIGAIDDTLHKVDADGNRVWKVNLPSRPYSVAVERDGSFAYVGFNDNSIRKYDGEDGTEVWVNSDHSDRVDGLAVGSGRYVYSASHDFTVRKFTNKGVLVWTFNTEDEQEAVAVDLFDNVFSVASQGSTSEGRLYKIDPDGFVLWTALVDGYLGAVAVDEESNSFAPDPGNYVNKVDPDGNVVWTSGDFGDQVESLVADEDSVYAGLQGINAAVIKLEADGTQAWSTLTDNVIALAWSP